MTHYIVQGGRYARAYQQLKARGFQLHWQSAAVEAGTRVKQSSKTKITCPLCSQNLWGKPGAQAICGACYADGGISVMHPEQEEGDEADSAG